MASISLENVYKRYGSVEAVKDVSLLCEEGKLMALLGPSGCGKSTTLKMIAGIEEVNRGEIYFDNKPVSHLAPGERNIAMVFEDYALYPHLTVAENIAFPLKIRKRSSAEIETKVNEALCLLGMSDIKGDNVQRLSGGAQQRVALGRAFVRDPELILFDEPLSHLDGDHKVQLRGEIKRLQKGKGLTSILVTHDQTEAIAMADLVAVMNQGVIDQVAEPQELYDWPANLFVANFIGEPPMNLISGELREDAGRLCLEGNGLCFSFGPDFAAKVRQLKVPSKIVVGIRPEHVYLNPWDVRPEKEEGITGQVFCREPRGDVDILLIQLTGALDKGGQNGFLIRDLLTVELSETLFLREGDPVKIRFDEDQLHIFNVQTGLNLLTARSHHQ
jgi:ABC-type sugar transport system ATPase subunit